MGSPALGHAKTDPRHVAVMGVVMGSVLAFLGFATGAGAVEVAVAGALALLIFLAPSIIASVRRVSHQGLIGVLNVAFGVTIVGWVAALALALRRSPRGHATDEREGNRWVLPDRRRDALDELGQRIVGVLGLPGARELLDVLTRSPENRAALIGRLYSREDATWLAEVLTETESDPDDLSRIQLIEALRRAVD
jgi:hypothetical protein